MTGQTCRPQSRIVPWSPGDLRGRLTDAMTLYVTAMGYPPEFGQLRRTYTTAHSRLPGFRAAAALGRNDELLGFGYGYLIAPGQWWHDQVRLALSPNLAGEWMVDAFELCELHVRPDAQGHGIGRELLTTLAALVAQTRILLSTPEGDTRAWRLYRSLGFGDLARRHHFPGDERPFAVLGARLPLADPTA